MLSGAKLSGAKLAAPSARRVIVPALTANLHSAVRAVVTQIRPAPARPKAVSARPKATPARPADAGVAIDSALTTGGGIGGLTGPAVNTTISGNAASATSTGTGLASTAGGGIDQAAALVSDTIAGNTAVATGPAGSAASGGGVATSTSLANTIVAGNSPADCGAPAGADLGGNLDSDGSCGVSAGNGSISAGQARLGGLRDNGGPARTRALRAGSQAIGLGLAATCEQDAGPSGVADTDQRGAARNSAARGVCDSGAYDTGGRAAG